VIGAFEPNIDAIRRRLCPLEVGAEAIESFFDD
jgi:hypothetical protein